MKRVVLVETSNLGLNSDSVKQQKTKRVAFLLHFLIALLWTVILPTLVVAGQDISTAKSQESIKEVDVEGLYSLSEKELLYLLNIEAGEELIPEKITQGIKRAFLKGIFDDIEVYKEGKGKIKVVVRERDIIEHITIEGNIYLSDRSIKRFVSDLPFKEGEIMRYDLLDKLKEHLVRSLKKKGFPNCKVDVNVMKSEKPYRVNLLIRITEGEPVRIKRLIIIGDESVKNLLGLKEGDIFDKEELQKGVERIKKHYKNAGRVNYVIGPYTFSEGELSIHINQGKKMNIYFNGNETVSSKTLMKELPFMDFESFKDEMIEEAVSNIKSLYHKKGFLNPQIAPVISEDGEKIDINFYIFEGKRVRIRSIRFSGNTIDEKNLKEIIISKEGEFLDPEALSSDKDIISAFYNALGYLRAEIDEPVQIIKDSEADIFINIKEGPQSIIKDIAIEGNSVLSDEYILSATRLKKDSPYNEVDISDARYRILDLYLERGFLDADVTVNREFLDSTVKITFFIKEGNPTYFGKTIIRGNKRTKNIVIERNLLHKEGKPFNYSLLSKESQKLYRLGLFTEVNLDPLESYDSSKDILVTLKEGNAGAIELGIGYGDYEKYRGFLDLSYRNLSGMNREGSLRIELSSLEERVILNYYEPWFLDRSLPLRIFALREDKKDKNIDTGEIRYRLTRHAITGGIERNLAESLKAELYYEFSVVKTFDVKPDVILSREDTGTLAISAISPGLIYDTRDNPFDPKRGFLVGLTIKAASGFLLSETDFIKVMTNVSLYKTISRRSTLALSLRAGIAQGFASTRDLPLIERFFLGGRNTVRGYEQDMLGPKGADGTPTGGNAFLVTNLELRNYIGKGFSVVTFIDGGNVWRKINEMNLSLRYTAGIGLRYNTPVGPLRIDYGHKLMREKGESRGEIHFSIGHAF